MTPDLSFLIGFACGVIIFVMYVSRVRIRVRGSYQVFGFLAWSCSKRADLCKSRT